MKNKRILWLLNHTTLREFEVPLLRSLGYEVYTPKIFVMNDLSGSVDFQFDESLTIPKEDLDILNNHDFYFQPINHKIRQIINDYFSIAIPGFFLTMLHELIRHFKGHIVIRAFGHLAGVSYSNIMRDYTPAGFMNDLGLAKDRVWFGQSYTNLVDIESTFLKKRAIDLPLGLSASIRRNEGKWIGGNNHILFVCPRIHVAPRYYGKIYRNFVRDFGSMPYIVAGGQPIPVNDKNVAGFQPREVFDEWLKTCKVMYYHSREPRHLHYHPLEAISAGMPLVYMRGGLLEHLGGSHQPGACHSISEAKRKIKRILNDDKELIDDIRNAQKTILETFSFEYCQKTWQQNFVNRFSALSEQKNNVIPATRLQKIAIFLPIGYRGGSFNAAKNMAKMLHVGSRNDGAPVQVVFSCVQGAYDIDEDFADLLQLGIQVRETKWQRIETKHISSLSYLQQKANYDRGQPFHQYPVDNVADFEDCDFWLLISDRTEDPLLSTKPYGVVVYDYIQRYVPELFGGYYENAYINTVRRAKFILTTTPQTRLDAIQYAGVNADSVHLLPMDFITHDLKIDNHQENLFGENYFVWATNCAPHKNHLNALESLEYYYNVLQGKYSILITDPSGLFTDPPTIYKGKYHRSVWEKLNKCESLKRHAHIVGYLDQKKYFDAVARSKFIWHPTRFDNGTFSVVEAAYFGIPALSSNYPQMHYINERFRLNMQFFDASDPIEMAKALKQMESMHLHQAAKLPEKGYLEKFSYDQLAPEVWRTVKELI